MLSVIQSEKLVLACILKDNSLFVKLEKNFFISDTAKKLYNTLKELYMKDMVFSKAHIIARGNFNDPTFFDKLEIEYQIEKFDDYVTMLKQKYGKQNIQDSLLKKTLIEVSKKDSFDIEAIKSLRDTITDNISFIEDKESSIKTNAELIRNYKKEVQDRTKGENKYETGDSYLDKYFKMGCKPGEMTTIFSDSGIGKTMFKDAWIEKRLNKKLPTIDVNLEMHETTATQRKISSRTRTPKDHFYPNDDGEFASNVLDILDEEEKKAERDTMYRYIREDDMSIDILQQRIRTAKLQMKVKEAVVFLDVATRLKEFNDSNSFAQEYERAVKKLLSMGSKENVHFVCIVHTNRTFENINITKIEDIDKLIPKPSAIKNGSAFEKDSRLVLGLMRRKFYMDRYFKDDPITDITDDIMEVYCLKYNDGSLFKLKYFFDADICRVEKYIEEK